MKRLVSLLFIGALAILLLYVVSNMPGMGEDDVPTRQNVIPRYLERAESETGTENVITGVILNYRGYDTMGEVTVIFTGLAAVIAILGRERRGKNYAYTDLSEVASSVIVRIAIVFLAPLILLFSFYTILHGDVSPGGGFQGGAIIGASLIIFTTIFGLWESTSRIPQKLRFPLEGAALLSFFTVGVIGIIGGGNFLTYMLPRLATSLQPAVRTWLTLLVEIGIGVGGAMVFISILFALLREEGGIVGN